MFKKRLIYIVFPCLLEFLVVIEICIILKRLSQLWLWCHWSWWVDEKCNKYMRGLRPIHDITVWVSQCAGQSMFLEGWACAKTMNGWGAAVGTFTKVISLCDFDLIQIKICLTYFSLRFWFKSKSDKKWNVLLFQSWRHKHCLTSVFPNKVVATLLFIHTRMTLVALATVIAQWISFERAISFKFRN